MALLAAFLLFFKEWAHPLTRFFLSLDLTVLYYPVYSWVHQHLADDKLPLICDNVMHGAPIAAYSMAGVLSPVLWFFHWISSYTFVFNLLFLAPHFLYLTGAYFLGRGLKFSRTASILLAFLWTFNGHQMAQLDHLNVAWAHAFFPWSFLALLKYLENRQVHWVLLSGLLLGLNLLSGHPQVFFLECLFFLFWALFHDGYSLKVRMGSVTLVGLGALLVASPVILFTAECLWGDFQGSWSAVDRYYHSWTPLNFLTLVYPWFFGKTQYDRAGADYWWQYQFVEMQVAFSIIGLFFIIIFFLMKDSRRKWIGITFLFALTMALGKFFFVYPLFQSLPIFSFFRDPARYWFLATWALGIGAAVAWDRWFGGMENRRCGRNLALGLALVTTSIPLLGTTLLAWGRPLLESGASFFIRHFLLGDAAHTQPLSYYLDRVPEKLDRLAASLNLFQPQVFLPVMIAFGLFVAVWRRHLWNLSYLKAIFLILVVVDLYAFRMPLGAAFYKPSDITAPQVPAPENRTLTLCYNTPSPLPSQYGEMAYPNMNILFNRPNLVFDANPTPRRYADLWAQLGWFSWVYKERDPIGFAHHANILRTLGVDQIVTDVPLDLPKPFERLKSTYPYVYHLTGVQPKAGLVDKVDYSKETLKTLNWGETKMSFFTETIGMHHLFVQKTFVPGWKARINDQRINLDLYNFVFISAGVPSGQNQIEFLFEPTSLRLGFFLFFTFLGGLTFFLGRRLLA